MAAPSLPSNLIDAGRRLLGALDDAGLEAEGSGWVYDHSLEEWRYIVATSLVETLGRSTVYRMLLSVMSRIEMPEELTIDDIHLVSTESGLYKGLASYFSVSEGMIVLENCVVGNKRMDAALYRWGSKPPTKKEMKDRERKFSRRIKQLSET